MLKSFEIARIKELAAQGFSRREITRLTGHGRKQIANILAGRRKRPTLAKPKARKFRHPKRFGITHSIDYVRCRECGRLVQEPCLACQIERLKSLARFLKAA